MSDHVGVLIVDDDPLVRLGLRLLLGGDPRIEVLGEASDGDEVAELVDRRRPDVVLMDVRMPGTDGIEATRRLAAGPRPPAVVMLTTFNADESVLAALRAGAAGFLLKHSAPDDIIEAVHRAASGDPVFSPGALTSLVAHARAGEPSGQDPDREASARWPQLSDRQREVAAAVARGMSNAQIASELYLSAGTVKADISTALSSLGLTNRIQLAILAHRLTSTEPSSPESPA